MKHADQRAALAQLQRAMPTFDPTLFGDSLREQLEGARYQAEYEILAIDEKIRRLDLANAPRRAYDELRDRRDVLHAALVGPDKLDAMQRNVDAALDADDDV